MAKITLKPEKYRYFNLSMTALFSILLVLVPFFPDIQITRPKLLVLEIGVFSLILLWLIRSVLSEEISLNSTNINLPVLVYVIFMFLMYYFCDNRAVALSELKRMLLCAGMYFIAANILASSKARLTVLYGWLTGSSLALIYGIMQRAGGFWVFQVPKMDRVISTFGNPIFFAVHLVAFLPVVLGLFFYTKKLIFKLILSLVFICGLFGLYYTQTRAAWIAFAVSLVFFGIFRLKARKARIIFISALAACCLIFAVYTRSTWTRQQAHLLIWRDSMKMWVSHPVFGVGPGNFHINFPNYASQELLSIWPQKSRIINDAHNEYVQILAETGTAGMLVFLWIISAFFIRGLSTYRNIRPGRSSSLLLGIMSGAAGTLVQNIFSVDMRFIISAVYLFLAIGLAASFEEKYSVKRFHFSSTVKYLLIALLLLLSGVVGFSKGPRIHLAGLVHLQVSSGDIKLKPSSEGSGLLPWLLQPYMARKTMDETPGFFDEKVLEPVKTLAGLEELSRKYPGESKIYEKLGWVYAKERNFRKAIENYEKAVRIDPNLFGAYNNLGNICFTMGNRAKSIEFYRKSLSINSNQVDAHLNLGIVCYYEGRLKEAADELNAVLKIDPNNDKAIVVLKKMRE